MPDPLFEGLTKSDDSSDDSLVNQSSSYSDLFAGLGADKEPEEAAPPARGYFGELTAGFGRGMDQLEQMGYGAGALVSSMVGSTSARDWFLKGYNVNEQELSKNPETVASLGDIDGMDKALRYGMAATGEFMPMVFQGLATSAIGMAIGSAAEPGGGTIAGGVTGLVARTAVKDLLAKEVQEKIGQSVVDELSSYLEGKVTKDALSETAQNLLTKQGSAIAKQYGADTLVALSNIGIMSGSLYGDLSKDPNIAESDRIAAASVGGLLSSIGMSTVFHSISKSFMGGVAADLTTQAGKDTTAEQAGYLARFAMTGVKEMGKNFGHVGGAMFAQTAINLAAQKWADPATRWDFLNYSPADWQTMIDSAVKGGIGGALVGGPISAFAKTTAHPDPNVREGMRTILQGADDAAILPPDVTPEDKELSDRTDKIQQLQSSIDSGKLTQDEMLQAQSDLNDHETRVTELKKSMGLIEEPSEGGDESLVNENKETVPEPKEEAKPTKVAPTPDEASVESLRALYADRMPSREVSEPSDSEIPAQKIADKQQEINDHIDSVAGDDPEYANNLKKAIKPSTVKMMAAENIRLATKPEGKLGYAADIDRKGNIIMYVPDAETARKESEGYADTFGTEANAAHMDYVSHADLAIGHEIIHVADLVNLRNEWEASDKSEKIRDFVGRKWQERGEAMREVAPLLARVGKAVYHPWESVGELSDHQLGQEIPRMAVEMGRQGLTTEATEAIAQSGLAGNKLNAIMRTWIESLKNIHEAISKWLTPDDSSNPELLKAYNDINKTLDKYGVLVNQSTDAETPIEAPAEAKPAPEPKAQAPPVETQPKPETPYRNFQKAIQNKGPSDAARAYLDWQDHKGQFPKSNADISAAHVDFTKRAPNSVVSRDRFRTLVKERVRNETNTEAKPDESGHEPAKKASVGDAGQTDAERSGSDLLADSRGESGYHHAIVESLAQKSQDAVPGRKLAAIREHLLNNHPALLPHFDNIVNEAKGRMADPEAQAKLNQQPAPIRGSENADFIANHEHAMFVGYKLTELSRELGKARGIEIFNNQEAGPTDAYIIDTNGVMKALEDSGVDHDSLVNQNSSVIWPENITNKLEEAQATDGIPETHALTAMGHNTIDAATVQALDEHFGENKWIIKNFSDDSRKSQGVFFAEKINSLLQDDPKFFDKFETGELMAQKLHDVVASDRASNVKILPGREVRVHVLTDPETGQAHVLPFSTFWKPSVTEAEITDPSKLTPITLENAEIQGAHDRAISSIMSLPEEERSGQFFGMDIVRQADGTWGTIENNPVDHNGQSGFFVGNPLSHDAYLAALQGEHPVHAEMARLAQDAMLGDSAEYHQANEPSLVNQTFEGDDEGEFQPAQKPLFSQDVDRRLNRLFEDTNEGFRKGFAPDALNEARSRTRERGGKGDFATLTPHAMEYKTQPQSIPMIRAQDEINKRGLRTVLEDLDKDIFVKKYKMNEADEQSGSPNAAIVALYGNAMRQVESMLAAPNLDRGAKMWLQDKFRNLENTYRTVLTPLGRATSMTGAVDRVVNGYTARRSYVDPIIGHLEKVLGKRGAKTVSMMGDALNQLIKDNADRVMNMPEMIAKLREVLTASKTKKFQDELRRTYAATPEDARNIVQGMAARMAEYEGMDKMGSQWAEEAGKRMVKDMNGLPVAPETKTETQILTSAVNQVARDNARELGLIKPSEGGEPTVADKLGAILKNEGLYREFTETLHQQMLDEYKPEPGSPFAKQVEEFRDSMHNRAWSQGMVDTLVNQSLRENETSFAKIAHEHYGLSDFRVEAFKDSVRKAMADRGVVNEGLLNQLVEDADGAMRSKIEQARLDFLGGPTGVRDMLKAAQTSLAEKAKQHAESSRFIPEQISKWLSNDLGIPDTKEMPLATGLQEIMTRQYNSMLADERRSIVEKMVAKATDGLDDSVKKKGLQGVDKILQLANLGVFSDEKAYTALAPKFGLPPFDPKVAETVMKLGDAIAKAPNVRLADDAKQVLANVIASARGVKPYDMFLAGLYTNMLSGPSTAGVHVTSNMTSVLGHLAVNAVQRPSRIPQMIRAVLRAALVSGPIEARETFFTGLRLYRTGDKFFRGENPLEMDNPRFQSKLDLGNDKLNTMARVAAENTASFMHRIYSGLGGKYIGRYLSAADAFFYKIAQEASFASKTGITENEEMRRSAMVQARKQMLIAGLNPDDNRTSRRKQEVLANQIVNEMRLVNQNDTLNENNRLAWVESHQEAMDATFKQDPRGAIGNFANLLETWARGKEEEGGNPIGKMFIPFTRIAANVTNQMLEWTPYGAVRWGVGHLYGDDFRLRNEKGEVIGRDPKVLIRSVMGTMGGMALYSTFAQHSDDKDPYLAIYDNGPSNPQMRRQMMDQGWRPKTFKVGGSYYSYVTTPFSMVFSILGRIFDNHRDGRDNENGIASSVVAMLQAVTHESFLSSMTDFMSAVDSPNPETKISRMMSRMATTPFIPNLVQQVDKWVDPSIQQAQGFSENFVRNIPVVRHELKPSLNVFGEPLAHEPGINLPGMERFLTMEKTDDPVLNIGSEKGITFPGFSKSTKLGNILMTPDQYYQYIQTAGPKVKQAIEAELPQLRAMTKEKAQERVNEIARKVKESVRDEMRKSS